MPARLPSLAVLAVLVTSSCTPMERDPAPLDRFTYPTGLTLTDHHLVVVSSNYDLTYEDDKGGSVLSVAPDAQGSSAPVVAGALRIPSFGGEIAIAGATACGLAGGVDIAAVPNRLTSELFRLQIGADGSIGCGDGCRVALADPGEGDPFTVDVACRPGKAPAAYVGWLLPRTGVECVGGATCAVISEVPLEGPGAPQSLTVLLNGGGIRKLSYDPASGLLFFVNTGSRVGWIDLSGGCGFSDEGGCPAQSVELKDSIAGFETRSVAASVGGGSRRLYVLGQLYDPARAASGIRLDLGGVLVVLDVGPTSQGGYAARLVRVVPLGEGVTSLEVIPRVGRRDLLAIAVTGDGEVWFWDDEVEAVTGVIGRAANGVPLVGRQPFGLAFQARGSGERPVRLFVGSFGDGRVSVVDLDPDAPSPVATWQDDDEVRAAAGALLVGRIGG